MKKLLIFIIIVSLYISGITGLYYKFNYEQPTVVKLIVTDEYGQVWEGTGCFVRDNLLLTAGHIVENAQVIKAQWPDGTIRLAYNWYEETEADLGIITIRTPQKERKAKFDDAKVGEEVWAIGNPFAVFPVMTKGIVSAVNMPDDYTHQKDMIITDAAINPGNSGCPLFNKFDRILGICSWGYNYSQGMSYFVRAEICELTLRKYNSIKALEEAE